MKTTQKMTTTTCLAASRRQFAKVASAAALLLAAGCSGGEDSNDKATKKEKAGMDFDELKEARRGASAGRRVFRRRGRKKHGNGQKGEDGNGL